MAKIKWNYDNVKSFVENYDYYLITNESEYINSNSNIEIMCHNNHKHIVRFTRFKNNPFKCKTCEKYNEVKNFIEVESNSGCKLLSTEYGGYREKLKLLCECGEIFITTMHDFKIENKTKCNNCSRLESILKRRVYTYGDVKNITDKLNYKIISINNKTNISDEDFLYTNEVINIICNNNHNISMTVNSIVNGHKCSICHFEKYSGENHPCWKGGITPLSKYIRKHCLLNWKKRSIKNCNYKCVITGGKFDVVHHLKGFDIIFSEALKKLNIDNLVDSMDDLIDINSDIVKQIENEIKNSHDLIFGICLRKDIHDLFHSIYGKGGNTPKQFNEFKKRYDNGEFNKDIKEEVV